jgi:hypothetical protein
MEKLDQYNEIVTKCRQLYMRFFWGDPLTEFEKDVEARYLVNKQRKYLKWLGTNVLIFQSSNYEIRDHNTNVHGHIVNKDVWK